MATSAIPTNVVIATSNSVAIPSCANSRRPGPDQRRVSASAASTASENGTSISVESRSQFASGVWFRSMAPIAPWTDVTQNPSAHVMKITSSATVGQLTGNRRGRSSPIVSPS